MRAHARRTEPLPTELATRQTPTSVRFCYLPALRGVLALNHSEPSKAIALAEMGAPYELGSPRSSIQFSFGALDPVYVRGLAYLATHQGVEAATEFQKILDHRGVVFGDPIGALAHLQLGRAFALRERRPRQKLPFPHPLERCRPGHPILKEAKAEYAKLN
jgi:eukaryotic-like serine/threonine-protein kinase